MRRPAAPVRRSRGRSAAVGLLLATGVALTGCGAPSPPVNPPNGATAWELAPRPTVVDEVDVTASVYRTRIDPSRGGIQLSVRNEADTPLAIVAARLETPLLAAAPDRIDEALIPAGAQRDLPMTLTDPVCPADAGDAAAPEPPDAVLVVPLANGSTGELRVPTTDRGGQWAAWFSAACFAAEVAEAVELSIRVIGGDAAGADGTIRAELVVRPRSTDDKDDGADDDGAASAELRLERVAGTVLLGAVGADGDRADRIPLEVVIGPSAAGDGERVVPLAFTPNRCDVHAIADDKQGTLFRVDAAIGERTGTVTVVAEPAAKDALYDAIGRACSASG